MYQYKNILLKVYKSYSRNKEVPEIKIKNKKLIKIGFRIGAEFTITYKRKKVILLLRDKKTSECNK